MKKCIIGWHRKCRWADRISDGVVFLHFTEICITFLHTAPVFSILVSAYKSHLMISGIRKNPMVQNDIDKTANMYYYMKQRTNISSHYYWR